jgi:hypothetical protein
MRKLPLRPERVARAAKVAKVAKEEVVTMMKRKTNKKNRKSEIDLIETSSSKKDGFGPFGCLLVIGLTTMQVYGSPWNCLGDSYIM